MKGLDAALSFHESALKYRTLRQEVLASNIANADTPNFKAKDLDFKAAMLDAMNSSTNPSMPAVTDKGHMSPNMVNGNPFNSSPKLKYREITQGSVDGNTVDMDVERNQFTENAIMYEASVTLLNSKLKSILNAIQG